MNMTPEFMKAVEQHLRLVDTLGMDHPDTMRAMRLSLELAPDELKEELSDMAQEMGLIPEAAGYLEDGTPMFRLEDIAERLDIPPEEAMDALEKMLAERKALGLSNDGVVTDASLIYRKQ